MDTELVEYNCTEFFEEYYSNGLFHPTEAQDLLPHTKIILDNKKELLQIGQIWDDHDLILCYRKGKEGVWGRSNYDGSFHLFSQTIKEFTEGWYQRDSNYWGALTQKMIWNEIEGYYQLNIARYNWKAYELLNFVKRGNQLRISNELFVKAYKNSIGISMNNGFNGRPFNKMVNLYFNDNLHQYAVNFQLSFFQEHNLENYNINQLDKMIGDIRKWIIKSV